MATFHVKAKKPWKTVDLDSSGFSQKDLEGLISFQELTDYEIIGSKKKKGNEVSIRDINVSFRDFKD
jgi:hypothetical protein